MDKSNHAGEILEAILRTRLMVTDFSIDVQDYELFELFSQIGDVVDVAVIKERKGGFLRRWALVEMRRDRDAQRAVAALNGRHWRGRTLRVRKEVE